MLGRNTLMKMGEYTKAESATTPQPMADCSHCNGHPLNCSHSMDTRLIVPSSVVGGKKRLELGPGAMYETHAQETDWCSKTVPRWHHTLLGLVCCFGFSELEEPLHRSLQQFRFFPKKIAIRPVSRIWMVGGAAAGTGTCPVELSVDSVRMPSKYLCATASRAGKYHSVRINSVAWSCRLS